MKKIILVLFILFLSCKKNQQSNDSNEHIINSEVKKEINDSIPKVQNSFNINELVGYKLIGMESNEDEKENDPYKKYSVDFTGACYSSDLCIIEVSKELVIFQNYYDKNISLEIKIKSYKSIENKLIFDLDNEDLTELRLIKLFKDLPLYEFKVKGTISEDIRISKYLSKENVISKFGGIDCGDFDG